MKRRKFPSILLLLADFSINFLLRRGPDQMEVKKREIPFYLLNSFTHIQLELEKFLVIFMGDAEAAMTTAVNGNGNGNGRNVYKINCA